MRSFSAVLAAAVVLAACTPKAQIDCTVAQAPSSQVIVKQLDMNVYKVLDTVKTNAAGRFRYSLEVKEGQPEFIYLFRGDTKIASLLLSAGDKVSVTADTLGAFEVQGSPESVRLRDNEKAYGRFLSVMDSTSDPKALYAAFVEHYRANTRYVMENAGSLTVVPLLFEQLDAYTPVFCQYSDAILFRKACDSLKTVYPQSRYVRALEKETERRENAMKMQYLVENASAKGYPDISLPDVNGRRTPLSEVESRAILLHFWDSSDATHKMFNLDVLKDIWNKWHDRGFDIYAVDVNPDKAAWAAVVKAQELPWINVNDGRGIASSAVMLYNVESIPASFLLVDGNLSASSLDGAVALDKELQRLLK